MTDPKSLHKYLYAGGDPINMIDPTGRQDMIEYTLLIAKATTGAFCLGYGYAKLEGAPGDPVVTGVCLYFAAVNLAHILALLVLM